MEKNNKLTIIPVMLCFFAMGFVDLVGTTSNYVKSRPLFSFGSSFSLCLQGC